MNEKLEAILVRAWDAVKVLANMVFSWKFILVMGSTLWYSGVKIWFIQNPTPDYALMSSIIIGYMAVKLVLDGSKTWENGDFRYDWTGNEKTDKLLSKVLSTKTWITVIGMAIAYSVGEVEVIRNLVIAWMGAQGLSEAAVFIKGADMSFLKKKAPVPVNVPSMPAQALPAPSGGTAGATQMAVVDTKPDYQEFDTLDWQEKVHKRASVNLGADSNPVLDFMTIPSLAKTEIAFYVQNVKDFAFWYSNMANASFEWKFGFPYIDVPKHFNDAGEGKLLKCPVQDVVTFKEAIPQDKKIVMENVELAMDSISNFFIELQTVTPGKLQGRLNSERWTYFDAFYLVGEIR